jgi:hypothetical protein
MKFIHLKTLPWDYKNVYILGLILGSKNGRIKVSTDGTFVLSPKLYLNNL